VAQAAPPEFELVPSSETLLAAVGVPVRLIPCNPTTIYRQLSTPTIDTPDHTYELE
jgi:hypothetical protein